MKKYISTSEEVTLMEFIEMAKRFNREEKVLEEPIDFTNLLAYPEKLHPSVSVSASTDEETNEKRLRVDCHAELEFDEDTPLHLLVLGSRYSGDSNSYKKFKGSLNEARDIFGKYQELWLCDIFYRPAELIYCRNTHIGDDQVFMDIDELQVDENQLNKFLMQKKTDVSQWIDYEWHQIKKNEVFSLFSITRQKEKKRDIAESTEKIHMLTSDMEIYDTAFNVMNTTIPMTLDNYEKLSDTKNNIERKLLNLKYGDDRLSLMIEKAKQDAMKASKYNRFCTANTDIMKHQAHISTLEQVQERIEQLLENKGVE